MAAPEFALEVSQNRYRSTEDRAVDAILTLTAGDLAVSDSTVAAEVILLDCSGSMNYGDKIGFARRAAVAAVETLRDGTFFAVVQGTDHAEMCYPPTARMAVADASTRAEATRQIHRMQASGGTRMGTWLTRASELFAAHPTAIRHAVLLTDGRNQHETGAELERALAASDGRFFCDARGIGEDWDPRELRRIVTVLRGAADAIRAEHELVDDFRALAEATMAKVVPDLRIRVTTQPGVGLGGLKQAHPRELDLTGNPVREVEIAGGRRVWEFSTGSWAAHETRDFMLSLEVGWAEGDPQGEDLLRAEVALLAEGPDGTGESRGPAAPVLVQWTSDPALSSRFDPKEIHYKGQAELTEAVQAGFEAYDDGRPDEAQRRWGTAVRLATESGNTVLLGKLERLVDVVDAGRGEVRLKPDVARGDLIDADLSSTHSVQAPRPGPGAGADEPGADQPDVTCRNCDRTLAATDRFCQCGTRVEGRG